MCVYGDKNTAERPVFNDAAERDSEMELLYHARSYHTKSSLHLMLRVVRGRCIRGIKCS